MGQYAEDNVVYVSFDSALDPYESLLKVGLNLVSKVCSEDFMQPTLVLLDDVQRQYSNTSFWEYLLKTNPNLFDQVRYVIACTHLIGREPSPIEFKSLPNIHAEELLLTHDESLDFLSHSTIGLPSKFSTLMTLKKIIANECNGLIGALKISIDYLSATFKYAATISEQAAIDAFLSVDLLDKMARCYGEVAPILSGGNIENVIIHLLADEVVNEIDYPGGIKELIKYGVLRKFRGSNAIGFSSPLAKRYFARVFYPNRGTTEPETLTKLVCLAIQSMSSLVLKQSVRDSTDFPKEATFQHLFMNGLAMNLMPNTQVCPELSKVFPECDGSSADKISGEVDFFIDGTLRWGIELLIQGRHPLAHVERFAENGKYAGLGCRDYMVVDFHGTASGEPTRNVSLTSEKEIKVYFKQGDYSEAKVFLANGQEVNLKLLA